MKQILGLALVTALALGACSPAETPPPPQTPVETPVTTAPEAPIQPGLAWAASATGEGAALTLSDAAGAAILRLGCIRNPATMTLEVDGFTPIASEDRLTVGLDDQLFVFVADLSASRERGVIAQAPVSTDFLDRLPGATAVAGVYGAQQFGPFMPPPADIAATFAAECRRAVSVS
ncbi:hypothetical protein [Phenylobacterium sp.]|uniref:hypothetical protein n=1 Tax=Phenylobacterium sp. TaxID=1871053 RepID=UPI00272F2815|nr:hypothetical protein [Phenylobacterium sp.]MDP1873739.1 hypothetical protein [Phenylobacterium sp.]MDP3489639.1 hypothetical protein [Phenylobacterium sp.]